MSSGDSVDRCYCGARDLTHPGLQRADKKCQLMTLRAGTKLGIYGRVTSSARVPASMFAVALLVSQDSAHIAKFARRLYLSLLNSSSHTGK